MPWSSKQSTASEESEDLVFDDGGSGLFDACSARFAKFGWAIECDSQHAVWVRNADASYAVGVAPWMVERRPLGTILDYVETKMKDAEVTLTV